MNSLSTGMNSICLGESKMVCPIPVHSKSENESRNEPCIRYSRVEMEWPYSRKGIL